MATLKQKNLALGSLNSFLLQQNWMKILSVLYKISRPLNVRDIIALTELSPGGAQDVLRRLYDVKIVTKKKFKNQILYSLNVEPEELKLLSDLVEKETSRKLSSRAKTLSARSKHIVGWIDETSKTIAKQKTHDATKSS